MRKSLIESENRIAEKASAVNVGISIGTVNKIILKDLECKNNL